MASWVLGKIFGTSGGDDDVDEVDQQQQQQQQQPQRQQRQQRQQDDAPPKLRGSNEAASESVVASIGGRLMYYSVKHGRMMDHLVGASELRLTRPDPDEQPYAYRIEVVPRGTKVAAMVEEINASRTPFVLDQGNHSLMWSSMPAGGADRRICSWSFVFDDDERGSENEQEFGSAFVRAQVEARRGQAFEKVVGKKAADHQFLYDSLRVPTTTAESEPDYESKYGGGDDERRMDWDDTDTQPDEDDEYQGGGDLPDRGFGRHVTPSRAARSGPMFAQSSPSPARGGGDRNALMEVGMANNRTFVVRGSQLGVFKHDTDDQLEYVGRIPEVRTRDGELFSPAKVQLHERDKRLLMLNPEDSQHVYCLDLETEKMVDQWDVGEVGKVRNIGASEKYAQRTNEDLVLGLNNNAVFSIDPRLNSTSKLAQKQVYKGKAPGLTCVATTDEGRAAVGSSTGEIRLYSAVDKRAKTCLPGLGDAVTGIDTTADGKWVLATCGSYLMLANTEIDGDAEKTGFDKPMGANARPPPIKLQLHPHDLAKYNIQDVNFTAARFNMGEGADVEHWIVTSTGPYIITWNFRSAKRGNYYDYRVKREYQEVVADNFRFGMDNQVVVTLTDDVLLQKRRLRPRNRD